MAENNDTIVRYYHNHSIDCTCLTNVCLKGSFDQVILVIKKRKIPIVTLTNLSNNYKNIIVFNAILKAMSY